MKFALLAFGNGWHVRDLHRAALAAGHAADFVDFRKVSDGVAPHPFPLSPEGRGERGEGLRKYDAVIVRTMPPGSLEQVVFRMDLLHRLRAEGVPVFNSPAALEASIDKYATTVKLHAAGLPAPATIVCQDADTALEAFDRLGGDVVVKPLFGSEGRGIVRVTDKDLAWRTFRTLERLQAVLYLQQYIDNPGWDLRAFVLGGRVLASMRRHANGNWRTNVAQGGRSEPAPLTLDQEELALGAAEELQVDMAGVDLLPDKTGRLHVLEVNAVPGWRALSATTGSDVAGAIIRHVEHRRNSARTTAPIGHFAQLACIWEATAQKAGNVHRLRDFCDLTYVDFLASGAAIAPVLDAAPGKRVGRTVLDGVLATRRVATTNSNLGIMLLLAPLAAATERNLRTGVERVLGELDVNDSRLVYQAIRLAQPGGLGRVQEQDVADEPTLPLRDIMALAAERDLIARQYVNGFRDVFDFAVPKLAELLQRFGEPEAAIILTHLELIRTYPDSLIARKHGMDASRAVSQRAAEVIEAGGPTTPAGRAQFTEFDSWLRRERFNPGTSADMVAASLFVALRQSIIKLPITWSGMQA